MYEGCSESVLCWIKKQAKTKNFSFFREILGMYKEFLLDPVLLSCGFREFTQKLPFAKRKRLEAVLKKSVSPPRKLF